MYVDFVTNSIRHETRSLPLPPNEERSRIDFIILIVDLTNRATFDTVCEQVEYGAIHPDFFATGKICLVATRGTCWQAFF